MATTFDTSAILQEIDTTQARVEARLEGAENLLSFKDLSPEDRTRISTLAAVYQQWHDGLVVGRTFFDQLPVTGQVQTWKTMSDLSVTFLQKLTTATTYSDWKVVIELAEELFRLIQEIAHDTAWMGTLLGGVKFFQVLTEIGHPVLPKLPVPETMLARLDRELEEAREMRAQFVAEPVAVKMIISVSEEEPI